jgi:hypothetical protein
VITPKALKGEISISKEYEAMLISADIAKPKPTNH